MSLLNHLRADVADDNPIPSGVNSSKTIINHLRLDAADDGSIPTSTPQTVSQGPLLFPGGGANQSELVSHLRLDVADESNSIPGPPAADASIVDELRLDTADDGSSPTPGQFPGAVKGPVTSTDNAVATWNGSNGDCLQSSPATINDDGDFNTPGDGVFGGKVQVGGAFCLNCRVVTSGASVSILDTDTLIMINKTPGSPTLVTLPATATDSRMLIIKDKKGDAVINKITIVVSGGGTIDGLTGFVISQNYQSVTLMFCGGSWSIV